MNNKISIADTSRARLMHAMLRVRDLEKSLDFYTRLLGMNQISRTDHPTGKFTIAFVGYGRMWNHTVIELTHNWDQDEPYEVGNGFGHLAIGVGDVRTICERVAAEGMNIHRPPGPAKLGAVTGGPDIAMLKDPDGYTIELVQEQPRKSLPRRIWRKAKAFLKGRVKP